MAVSFVAILAALFSLYFTTISSSRGKFKEYQSEINKQIARTIEKGITKNLKFVESISDLLSKNPDRTSVQFFNQVDFLKDLYGISEIIISDVNGKCRVKGKTYDISDKEYFLEAMEGKTLVSDPLDSFETGEKIIVYASPYFSNEKICGIVIAIEPINTLKKILQTANNFFEDSFIRLIDTHGDYITQSEAFEPDYTKSIFDDLFYILKDEEKILSFLKTISDSKKTQVIEHSINGIRCANIYTPVNYNGWFIYSVVPINLMTKKQILTTFIFISLCFILFGGMIFSLFTTFKMYTKHEEELRHLAYTDRLTGKGNFQWFIDEGKKIIDKNQQNKYVIVSINILNFNLFNQKFGRAAGDKKIIDILSCIQNNLNSNEIAARTDGDNFKLLMYYDKSTQSITDRLAEISRQINKNDITENKNKKPFFITLTAGVCLLESCLQKNSTIKKNSSVGKENTSNKKTYDFLTCYERSFFALSSAKSVKDSFLKIDFFREKDLILMNKQQAVENRMHEALDNQEFVVYLQPKFSLEQNRILGAEALTRWESKDKGIEYPNSFIPIFENNGFILELDLFVFEQICSMIRRWIDKGLEPVTISINLSRAYLNDLKFIHHFEERRKKYDVPAKYLELEITESAVLEKATDLSKIVHKIKELGYKCSIDDFGAGYSSLNILKDIPVDTIKIDKGFFSGKNAEGPKSTAIITSVINLAKKLNMKTVSEGIENDSQVTFLKDAQCDMIQGYYYFKPLKIPEFEKLVFGI
ncbi:MAG: bifunctional diguanylate cyclase/phosphodiesterase [Treponemataceae bacterium]